MNLQLIEVNKLTPAFNGFIGWISMTELNVIDPYGSRFEITKSADFIDGTTFVFAKLILR